MQGIDIITEQYCEELPESYSKFFSRELAKSPKIIMDEVPHYRMFVDIT